MNQYEEAAERYNEASQKCKDALELKQKLAAVAEEFLEIAEAQFAEAKKNLARYESRPGIPLPEYR